MKTMKAGRIHKDDIQSTLAYVAEKFNIDPSAFKLLGSSGKQETSGDIDVGLNKDQYERSIFLNSEFEAKEFKGFDLVSMLVPIQGEASKSIDEYDGFVQLDIFFGNTEWMKFTYYSPGNQSEYAGKYRTELLASMISEKANYIRIDPNGEVISRIGPVFNRTSGLYTQYSHRHMRKDGNGRVKNFALVDSSHSTFRNTFCNNANDLFIDNPNDLAEFMFNDASKINTFNSFENLMEWFKTLPSYRQASIKEIFKLRIGIELDDVPRVSNGAKTL